ncbi:retinal pigment epithelial membrane protein-domain-containing protein [Diaporthe sp. PMI_573]|nr:retinal pigment epithelial membrane protein-domain-containing protein [Diaporthaceae sp. PMI_573]
MLEGWFAQELRFVPRQDGTSEGNGWWLTHVLDESQLNAAIGDCRKDAKSELWVIDAKTMKDIVAQIWLPQRLPFGLHGWWFTKEEVVEQKPFIGLRTLKDKAEEGTGHCEVWLSAAKVRPPTCQRPPTQ